MKGKHRSNYVVLGWEGKLFSHSKQMQTNWNSKMFFKSSSHNFNWQEITTSKFEALARRRVKVDWGNQRTVRGDKETGCSETGLIFFSRVRFSIFTNWNLKQKSMVTSKSLSLWVHGLLASFFYVTKPFEESSLRITENRAWTLDLIASLGVFALDAHQHIITV